MCSGLGTCEKMSFDPDWCDCDFINAVGDAVDVEDSTGKEWLH